MKRNNGYESLVVMTVTRPEIECTHLIVTRTNSVEKSSIINISSLCIPWFYRDFVRDVEFCQFALDVDLVGEDVKSYGFLVKHGGISKTWSISGHVNKDVSWFSEYCDKMYKFDCIKAVVLVNFETCKITVMDKKGSELEYTVCDYHKDGSISGVESNIENDFVKIQ